jgi:hypothetical protein
MKSKLIVIALAAMSFSAISYAADDKMPAKPQSGSATTEQESPSHPATEPAAGAGEKAKAGTSATQAPTHPAAKGKETSGEASTETGAKGVRDWSAIDTDRDNSISPEEMQKFLEKAWTDAKKPT